MEEPYKLAYQFEDELSTCEMIAETMCKITGIKRDKWKDYYKIIYNLDSGKYELYLKQDKKVKWDAAMKTCLN